MPGERIERILDAAYQCLVRHGVRKTTMEDIAAAAGMSRPAVYQYVRNKQDVFDRLAARLFGAALDRGRTAAAGEGTLAQRLDRVLSVRLELVHRLHLDSPHAGDLLGPSASVRHRYRDLEAGLAQVVAATITDAAGRADLPLRDADAREIAELALALTRGLETDPDQGRSRERLRTGIALLVAGLAAAARTGR